MKPSESFVCDCTGAFITTGQEVRSFGVWVLGRRHAIYDLGRIEEVLERLLDDERVEGIPAIAESEYHPTHLLQDITAAIA